MSTDTPASLPAELSKKHDALKEHLTKLGAVAVAFSGGVDSTLLLSVAADVLGDNTVAITARAQMIPAREVREASDFCAKRGIRHVVMDVDALTIPGFAENPADRCYLCKSALFARIMDQAARLGIPYVAEGTNTSDLGDYRPGLKALGELKVDSPLLAAGLSKTDVRALSRMLGLPTWDKPSYACLAQRGHHRRQASIHRACRGCAYGRRLSPDTLPRPWGPCAHRSGARPASGAYGRTDIHRPDRAHTRFRVRLRDR